MVHAGGFFFHDAANPQARKGSHGCKARSTLVGFLLEMQPTHRQGLAGHKVWTTLVVSAAMRHVWSTLVGLSLEMQPIIHKHARVSMDVLSMHGPRWWTILSELQLPHKDVRVSTATCLPCWVADADNP